MGVSGYQKTGIDCGLFGNRIGLGMVHRSSTQHKDMLLFASFPMTLTP